MPDKAYYIVTYQVWEWEEDHTHSVLMMKNAFINQDPLVWMKAEIKNWAKDRLVALVNWKTITAEEYERYKDDWL